MTSFFSAKTILVTGATGSIGSEIVSQLLAGEPEAVRLFSRDEHKQFLVQQRLDTEPRVRYFLGDVRDLPRLSRACEGVDYVFHCAAYKHVPFCEYNSFEAVKTNVIGTQNVVEAAILQGVKRVLLVSTDKAAGPTSVMGATKLLAEKLMTSAMQSRGKHSTLFSSVRFGNVIGSRGSVIPTFIAQILKGGPVTITDPNMTRFFLSIPKAVGLTFHAMEQMGNGELFILKMPVMRLGDLVDVLIEEVAPRFDRKPADIEKRITGARPGERMHENLMTREEAQYATETGEMFVVHSPLRGPGEEEFKTIKANLDANEYSSGDQKVLSRAEISVLIKEYLDHQRAPEAVPE